MPIICWRELENESVANIKSLLLKNELIDKKHKSQLSGSCVTDLAGLVFGVPPEKGAQLLLEPEISTALETSDAERLSELYRIHSEAFWPIFNYHFEHTDLNTDYVFNASETIFKSIWGNHSEKCKGFVNKVVSCDLDMSPKEINWSAPNINKYICLLNVSRKHNAFVKKIYQSLISGLNFTLDNNEDLKWPEIITCFSNVNNTISDIDNASSREVIDKLTLPKLIQLSKTSVSLKIDTSDWFAPSPNIIGEIKTAIVAGQPLTEGLFAAIHYSINAGITKGWEAVLTQCQQYINWNSGTYSNQSDDIFKIISLFAYKTADSLDIVKSIIQSGQYHQLFDQRKAQNLIDAALLCGFVLGKDLHTVKIPSVGQSQDGIAVIRSFWLTSNTDNAQKLFAEIKKYNLWLFLWDLVEDNKNKLVGDIISLALDDQETIDLFKVDSILLKLKHFSSIIKDTDKEDDTISKLIKKFITCTAIEEEIIAWNNIDIVEYDYQLYFITRQTENEGVIAEIVKNLKTVDKDAWGEALENDTYLTSLALEIKDKNVDYNLENAFMDAFIEFANKRQSDEHKYADWQKKHWQELVSLMGSSFQTKYKQKISEFLCEHLQDISLDSFTLNKEFFSNKVVIDNRNKIGSAVEDFAETRDFERLKLLNDIVPINKKNMFKIEKHTSDILKAPLRELLRQQENDENKEIIRQLANKFKITLIEHNE